jgi:hypothetical protein
VIDAATALARLLDGAVGTTTLHHNKPTRA